MFDIELFPDIDLDPFIDARGRPLFIHYQNSLLGCGAQDYWWNHYNYSAFDPVRVTCPICLRRMSVNK